MSGQRLLVVMLVIAFTFGGLIAPPRTPDWVLAAGGAPCESDGVAVRYDVSFQAAPIAGHTVDAVQVSDIAGGCAGQTILVQLTKGGAVIGTGGPVQITADQMTVAMASPPLAEEVDGVHVEIDGDGSPGPTPSPTPSPTPPPRLDIVQTGPCAGFALGSQQPDPTGVFGWIFVGTERPDLLVGGPSDDLICGLFSADQMNGGRGGDLLLGAGGDDVGRGGRGRDWVRGRTGSDRIMLGKGRDRGVGGRDADSLEGGTGRDLLRGGNANDVLRGGPGRDLLRGGNANDVLGGGPGEDVIWGGNGFDTCYVDDADLVRGCELVIPR